MAVRRKMIEGITNESRVKNFINLAIEKNNDYTMD